MTKKIDYLTEKLYSSCVDDEFYFLSDLSRTTVSWTKLQTVLNYFFDHIEKMIQCRFDRYIYRRDPLKLYFIILQIDNYIILYRII